MDIFNVKALREKNAELVDSAKAISNLIKGEEREPTGEEKAELDRILDVAIPEVKAQIEKAEKYEAEVQALANSRHADGENGHHLTAVLGNDDCVERLPADQMPLSDRIAIPAQCRFHMRSLRSFAGPKAPEQAYIAGRFYAAALMGHDDSRKWCSDRQINWRPQAALTTGDNALGGILVPQELEQRIIVLREERGVFAREARLERMASDTKIVPRYASGPTAYFVGDNDTITASDIKHDNIELVAKKVACLVLASAEISDDAFIDLGDMITQHIAYKLADKEDECGFNGDGTSTYGGMVGLKNAIAAGSKVTAPTADIAFSDLLITTFEDMVGKLPNYADMGNAKWYIHRAGWAASMARLADAVGGNTNETIASGPSQRMFLGYPVVFVNVMNSTLTDQASTDGLVYFGDLSQAAAFGLRRGISLAMSDQRYFELDQLAFRGLQRFTVNIHERGTATVAGSIIMLSTPAS